MDMTAIRGNWCPGKSYKKIKNKHIKIYIKFLVQCSIIIHRGLFIKIFVNLITNKVNMNIQPYKCQGIMFDKSKVDLNNETLVK